nr:probable 6-phosphogluconolactonase 4, chloroplastic [Tanacetum cinerariifolium]
MSVNMTKSEKKVQVFDSEESLSVSLAEYVNVLSDKSVKEKGSFTVVVSGGSLIKSLRKLVEAPYIDSIDWSKWHMFWVDERVVPKDHPDSNYLLAYDGFLSKVSIPSGNIHAINDTLSAEGAADEYETNIKNLVQQGIISTSEASGIPKFDVMLLGMGPDGHVASLFPGHPLLEEKNKATWTGCALPAPATTSAIFAEELITGKVNVILSGGGFVSSDGLLILVSFAGVALAIMIRLLVRTITYLQTGKPQMGKVNILKFHSEEDVAVALAKYIADLSAKFMKENGSFSVVLSGGTLIDTLRKLLEPPYIYSIECNYKLALDGFLSKVPIPKSNIYAINDKLSPEDAAADYERHGHVASLFCWHFQRFEKTKWVTFIKDSPKPPSERITFTFPLINAASEIAMVVTGEDAADAVKIALRKASNSNSCFPLPAEKVSPVGKLTWFLDNDATSGLSR